MVVTIRSYNFALPCPPWFDYKLKFLLFFWLASPEANLGSLIRKKFNIVH